MKAVPDKIKKKIIRKAKYRRKPQEKAAAAFFSMIYPQFSTYSTKSTSTTTAIEIGPMLRSRIGSYRKQVSCQFSRQMKIPLHRLRKGCPLIAAITKHDRCRHDQNGSTAPRQQRIPCETHPYTKAGRAMLQPRYKKNHSTQKMHTIMAISKIAPDTKRKT